MILNATLDVFVLEKFNTGLEYVTDFANGHLSFNRIQYQKVTRKFNDKTPL